MYEGSMRYKNLMSEVDNWSHLLDEPKLSDKMFLICITPLKCKRILILMRNGLTKEQAYGKLSGKDIKSLLMKYKGELT